MDTATYNQFVNITDDSKLNSINFLESLIYRNNVKDLLKLSKIIELETEASLNILPSFKGKTLLDMKVLELIDEQESYLECLKCNFPEYDGTSIFDYIQSIDNINRFCTKIFYDPSDESFYIFIKTKRYIEENTDKTDCLYFILEN